jgi:Ring finger domain
LMAVPPPLLPRRRREAAKAADHGVAGAGPDGALCYARFGCVPAGGSLFFDRPCWFVLMVAGNATFRIDGCCCLLLLLLLLFRKALALTPTLPPWFQVLKATNFSTPRPAPMALERSTSGGGTATTAGGGGGGSGSMSPRGGGLLDRELSSSSSAAAQFSVRTSLRNLGIGPRNTSLGQVDEEIRIPVPGFLLSDGGEGVDAVDGGEDPLSPSSPSSPSSTTPMRWASGSCTICLGAYQVGESVTWSSNPDCDHCFHTSCIEEWVLRKRPMKNNRRRRNNNNEVDDDDADGNVPLCPNCRRPFVVVDSPAVGGARASAGRGGASTVSVARGSSSMDDGGAAASHAAYATAVASPAATDPFHGGGAVTAVHSGADPPASSPGDSGGGSGGGGVTSSDGGCQSIDV